MALDFGDNTAGSGMSQLIYDYIDDEMGDDIADLEADEQEAVREKWRKLAYAVARGVVEHITTSLEIVDSTTNQAAERDVEGESAAGGPGNHVHDAGTLAVTLDDLKAL